MTRPFNQADIDAEIGHRVNDILAVADAQLQRQTGKVAAKSGYHARQQVIADGAAGVNTDCAVVLFKQLFDFTRLLQQANGARIEQTTVFVQHQPLADAIEQLNAKLALQIRQRRAHRRLRERQHLRGLGRRAAFQHLGKHFYLTQRDMHGFSSHGVAMHQVKQHRQPDQHH